MANARVASSTEHAPNVAGRMAVIDVQTFHMLPAQTAQLALVDGLQLLHLCIVQFVGMFSSCSSESEVGGVGFLLWHFARPRNENNFSDCMHVIVCTSFLQTKGRKRKFCINRRRKKMAKRVCIGCAKRRVPFYLKPCKWCDKDVCIPCADPKTHKCNGAEQHRNEEREKLASRLRSETVSENKNHTPLL